MKYYENPQCLSEQDFHDDLKIIKYLKRLLNRYHLGGELKERLILNHLITLGNVFPIEVLTRILFLKIPEESAGYEQRFKEALVNLNRVGDGYGVEDEYRHDVPRMA